MRPGTIRRAIAVRSTQAIVIRHFRSSAAGSATAPRLRARAARALAATASVLGLVGAWIAGPLARPAAASSPPPGPLQIWASPSGSQSSTCGTQANPCSLGEAVQLADAAIATQSVTIELQPGQYYSPSFSSSTATTLQLENINTTNVLTFEGNGALLYLYSLFVDADLPSSVQAVRCTSGMNVVIRDVSIDGIGPTGTPFDGLDIAGGIYQSNTQLFSCVEVEDVTFFNINVLYAATWIGAADTSSYAQGADSHYLADASDFAFIDDTWVANTGNLNTNSTVLNTIYAGALAVQAASTTTSDLSANVQVIGSSFVGNAVQDAVGCTADFLAPAGICLDDYFYLHNVTIANSVFTYNQDVVSSATCTSQNPIPPPPGAASMVTIGSEASIFDTTMAYNVLSLGTSCSPGSSVFASDLLAIEGAQISLDADVLGPSWNPKGSSFGNSSSPAPVCATDGGGSGFLATSTVSSDATCGSATQDPNLGTQLCTNFTVLPSATGCVSSLPETNNGFLSPVAFWFAQSATLPAPSGLGIDLAFMWVPATDPGCSGSVSLDDETTFSLATDLLGQTRWLQGATGCSPGAVQGTAPTQVIPSVPSSTLEGKQTTYQATVETNPPGGAAPQGTVTFAVGSTTLCTATVAPTTSGTGQGIASSGSCQAANAPVGADTVTVTYEPATSEPVADAASSTTAVEAVYPTPTVLGVQPASGSVFGGTTVELTGTFFEDPSLNDAVVAVDFGTQPGTNLTILSPTALTVVSPPEVAGTVDVHVITAHGATSPETPADQFTYVAPPPPPPPQVSSISPTSGPPQGGTQVTIDGANLLGTAAVDFGSTPATSFQIVSSSEIVAVSPPGVGGTSVQVSVASPGGTSAPSSGAVFSYTAPPPPPPSYAASPARVCDTRPGNPSGLSGSTLSQCEGKPIGAGGTLAFSIPGAGSDPTVVLAVTVVEPSSGGSLSVYPAGGNPALGAEVPVTAGVTSTMSVLTTTNPSGQVTIANQTASSVNVVVDVEAEGALPVVPVRPTRVCDTRLGNPSGLVGQALANCAGGAVPRGSTTTVDAGGIGAIPASGLAALVVQVTDISPSGPGFLTLWSGTGSPPMTSQVTGVPGEITSNLVVVPVSSNGAFSIYSSSGNPNLVVDVEGWVPAAPSSSTALLEPASGPTRVCDTRPGNPSGLSGLALSQCEGKAPGPLGSLAVSVAPASPPAGATGAFVFVTASQATAPTYLAGWDGTGTVPLASVLDASPGQVVVSPALVGLSQGSFSIFNLAGTTQVAVDVLGFLVPPASG
jgi:stage V sporulation protein SpoVS